MTGRQARIHTNNCSAFRRSFLLQFRVLLNFIQRCTRNNINPCTLFQKFDRHQPASSINNSFKSTSTTITEEVLRQLPHSANNKSEEKALIHFFETCAESRNEYRNGPPKQIFHKRLSQEIAQLTHTHLGKINKSSTAPTLPEVAMEGNNRIFAKSLILLSRKFDKKLKLPLLVPIILGYIVPAPVQPPL